MKNIKLCCLLLLFISAPVLSQQQEKIDLPKLEKQIQQTIKKIYGASVFIVTYRTDYKAELPAGCSGVVVSADGYILSAGHCVIPGQQYHVKFPDGRTAKATGLGSILIKASDAGILKITDKGSWPFAEMGWSSSLSKYTPCLSVSYPGSLTGNVRTPTVRFGYVADPVSKDVNYENMLRTTCLMEPGDSGGPVFDFAGRVIGIHSRIGQLLDQNYETPVDDIRRYWNALLKPIKYEQLPEQQQISLPAVATPQPAAPALANWYHPELIKTSVYQLPSNCFAVESTLEGKRSTIMATLVNPIGLAPSAQLRYNSYLISKSSMLGNDPELKVAAGKTISAQVIKRDEANDLVLIAITEKIAGGFILSKEKTSDIDRSDIGRILISPLPQQKKVLSVLANQLLPVSPPDPLMFYALSADGKIIVVGHDLYSPLRAAKLQPGDEVKAINGKPITLVASITAETAIHKVKDSIDLRIVRAGKVLDKRIALFRPTAFALTHVARDFPGGSSIRHNGFAKVLVHDGILLPEECGSPLLGIDGRLYGINIARLSRTSSLAIPIAKVQGFVKTAL